MNHKFSKKREMFLAHMLSVCSLFFLLCFCLLSAGVFSPSCPQIAEEGTKGDRNDRDVSDA